MQLELLNFQIYISWGPKETYQIIIIFKMGECNEWGRLNLIILISWGVQKSKREIENVNFKGKLFILKKKPNFMVV